MMTEQATENSRSAYITTKSVALVLICLFTFSAVLTAFITEFSPDYFQVELILLVLAFGSSLVQMLDGKGVSRFTGIFLFFGLLVSVPVLVLLFTFVKNIVEAVLFQKRWP